MKYSCYQDSSVIHGLFLALLVEKCALLVKVNGNPILDGIIFKTELTHLPLLEAYEG